MERDARVLFFLHQPLFSCTGSVGSGSFSILYYLSPWDCRLCVFLGSSSWTTVLSLTHVQGKIHPFVESRWAQRRWSCLPSEKFRPNSCHGNGMLPTKLCDTTDPLWEKRRVMSPKWEALTVTPQLLTLGQPELMIWRYVDTKLKDDPLDVLDTWMISILSSTLLMATTFIRLLSKYPLLRLDFGLWYIWKGPGISSFPVFSNSGKKPPKYERDDKFHSRAQTMKIGPSAFNQGPGPQYQPWGHIGTGGRTIPCFWTYTSIDEITH